MRYAVEVETSRASWIRSSRCVCECSNRQLWTYKTLPVLGTLLSSASIMLELSSCNPHLVPGQVEPDSIRHQTLNFSTKTARKVVDRWSQSNRDTMDVSGIYCTVVTARLRVCSALRSVPGFPELPFGLGSLAASPVPRSLETGVVAKKFGEKTWERVSEPLCGVLPFSHSAPRALLLYYYYSPTLTVSYHSLSLLLLLHSLGLTRCKPWLPPKRDSASASRLPCKRASSQSAQPKMSTSRPSLLLHSP